MKNLLKLNLHFCGTPLVAHHRDSNPLGGNPLNQVARILGYWSPVCFLLLSSLLWGCQEQEVTPDGSATKQGQLILSAFKQESTPVRLTNARQLQSKELPLRVYIYEGEDVVDDFYIQAAEETVTLPAGTYNVEINKFYDRGIYQGEVELYGSLEFDIVANETTKLDVGMHRYNLNIVVNTENMPEAKIYIGEQGFTPSEVDFYDPVTAYPDGFVLLNQQSFEVVVDYQGKQKRYSVERQTDEEGLWIMDYIITIVNKEEPTSPTDTTSNVKVGYQLYDEVKSFTFEW